MRLFLLLFLFATPAYLLEDEEPGLSDLDHDYFEALEKDTNYTMFESDILISGQVANGMSHSALGDPDSKWKDAKVAVAFSTSLSQREKDAIRGAIGEIQEKTCVRFHYKTVDDADYVTFLKPWQSVCNSYVGRIGGGQPLNLGQGCYDRNTILHEIMHALGFVHEHTRSDRDDYVQIMWQNIEPGMEHNFNKYEEHQLELMDTPYSFESIMHYTEEAFSKYRGQNTIVPKRGTNKKIGGENRLSDIDTLRINKRYSCSGFRTTTRATEPPPPPPQPTWYPTVTFQDFFERIRQQSSVRCVRLPNGGQWCTRSAFWTSG